MRIDGAKDVRFPGSIGQGHLGNYPQCANVSITSLSSGDEQRQEYA